MNLISVLMLEDILSGHKKLFIFYKLVKNYFQLQMICILGI